MLPHICFQRPERFFLKLLKLILHFVWTVKFIGPLSYRLLTDRWNSIFNSTTYLNYFPHNFWCSTTQIRSTELRSRVNYCICNLANSMFQQATPAAIVEHAVNPGPGHGCISAESDHSTWFSAHVNGQHSLCVNCWNRR